MKRRAILLTLLLILLLAVVQNASAMASTHYRLDWFIPMTSGSGGPAASAHYAINYSLGQTAISNSTSTHYGVGLGFWNGIERLFRLYLPLIFNNH
jgi:hypothetical protein